MTAIPYLVPDSNELETRVLAWPDRARALKITDEPSYLAATELTKEIKDLRKEIADTFDEAIAAAYAAHKKVVAAKKRHEDPLIQAEQIIKAALSDYYVAQERKRREEEIRLREIARQQEEERRIQEAIAAEADGDFEAVDEILEAPAPIAPPVKAAPAVPKVSGVTMRETWEFEVGDIMALIRHVADHPEDRNLLVPNTTAIRALVLARKDAFSLPGVRAYRSNKVAAGRR